ncbi:MAG: enoyl-CoA hydratase-related protein [Bdellovibrionota bacterium]
MTEPSESIQIQKSDGIGEIRFFSPKANSLSLSLLSQLTHAIDVYSADPAVKVILLCSSGEGSFCGGASFDEFQRISTLAESEQFFMGFANVILAGRRSPKLIVARVQGKAVGGGVGLIAAADYACASASAAARLSELELGIGPFTIGPAVERKIGLAAFSAMSIDCAWRDADWLLLHGLFSSVSNPKSLDGDVGKLLDSVRKVSAEAAKELKRMLWHGSQGWEELLPERARTSGRLLLEARARKASAGN